MYSHKSNFHETKIYKAIYVKVHTYIYIYIYWYNYIQTYTVLTPTNKNKLQVVEKPLNTPYNEQLNTCKQTHKKNRN